MVPNYTHLNIQTQSRTHNTHTRTATHTLTCLHVTAMPMPAHAGTYTPPHTGVMQVGRRAQAGVPVLLFGAPAAGTGPGGVPGKGRGASLPRDLSRCGRPAASLGPGPTCSLLGLPSSALVPAPHPCGPGPRKHPAAASVGLPAALRVAAAHSLTALGQMPTGHLLGAGRVMGKKDHL